MYMYMYQYMYNYTHMHIFTHIHISHTWSKDMPVLCSCSRVANGVDAVIVVASRHGGPRHTLHFASRSCAANATIYTPRVASEDI